MRLRLAAISAFLAWAGFAWSLPPPQPALRAVGNDACRPCHAAIYESYSRTAMARTSGPAFPPLEGAVRHVPSGVSYRVYQADGKAFLSYDREGERPLHGTQELKYSVGSNARGRTYLFEIDGFWYQSPINYYADQGVWDMSPGYGEVQSMELNHPVDSTCLFCHASRVQPPTTGTVNHYADRPFLQDGVGCERCHGPGSEHVNGRGPMVNPARLAAEPRDSICMQCHLEGEARIAKKGQSEQAYRPGESFSDYVAIFVRENGAPQQRGAVSHVESLALSQCKQKSGSAMSCLSCHDPHVQPDAAGKAAYYRARCLQCHAAMAKAHYARQPDCTSCHMPRLDSADIGHTVVTDHRILRDRRTDLPRSAAVGRLVQFGNPTPDPRDLGLAYGEVALRDEAFAAAEAQRLLEATNRTHPDDPAVLTRLAYLHQARGDNDAAEQDYERALAIDPDLGVAAADLGVFLARRGLLPRAMELWRRAFEHNPQLSDIGLNLSLGLCAAGDTTGARETLQRVLEHNPDLDAARQRLAEVAGQGCPPK